MWDLRAHLKFKTSTSLNSCGLQHKSKSSAVMHRAKSRFCLGLRAAVGCIETECLEWVKHDWAKSEKRKSGVCQENMNAEER